MALCYRHILVDDHTVSSHSRLEDGGSMFLQNIGAHVPKPRLPKSGASQLCIAHIKNFVTLIATEVTHLSACAC